MIKIKTAGCSTCVYVLTFMSLLIFSNGETAKAQDQNGIDEKRKTITKIKDTLIKLGDHVYAIISDGEAGKLRHVRLGDVGVVFQRYPLFEDLKVIDNLIAPAVRSGIPAKEAKEKALSFMDEFDLVRQGLAWPLQLSGGQRQRVAILQQLMLDRHFIILDEPFSGLDPVNVSSVINLISRVAHQHTLNTFIIITHDVTSALAISDHVYLLGRERDENGEPVPGSRVMKEYDLIAEGLAYRPDIEDLPRFAELRKEIRLIEFPRL